MFDVTQQLKETRLGYFHGTATHSGGVRIVNDANMGFHEALHAACCMLHAACCMRRTTASTH